MPTPEDIEFAKRVVREGTISQERAKRLLYELKQMETRGQGKSLEQYMAELGLIQDIKAPLDIVGGAEATLILPGLKEGAEDKAEPAPEIPLDIGNEPTVMEEVNTGSELEQLDFSEEGSPPALEFAEPEKEPASPAEDEDIPLLDLFDQKDEEAEMASEEAVELDGQEAPEPAVALEAGQPDEAADVASTEHVEEVAETEKEPPVPPPAPAPPSTPQEQDPLIGQVIGGYKVASKLGQGGMGAVYLAQDTKLSREIALKVLPESVVGDNQRLVERFLREARAASRIQHKNIVQVYGMGKDDGLHWIAMEVVRGGSVSGLIRSQQEISVETCLRIIRETAEGLYAAEQKNVIHRDIKPSNILLDEEGHPKIADFGLAKSLGVDSDLTYSGQVLGTPHFMSPEQCEGETVDSRADIYSLGATFYYLVTGRYPFIGETALSVMLKHKTEPIVPPEELHEGLPKNVSAIIHKMMAKDINDRYQSFKEVIEDIDRALAGKEIVHAKAAPAKPPTKRRPERMRALLSVVRGKSKGRTHRLEEGSVVTIGRDSTKSDFHILDAMISRIHCVVRATGSKFVVSDFGSANGTSVNGERVKSQELHSGDRIQIGKTELLFRLIPRANDAIQLANLAVEENMLSQEDAEQYVDELAKAEASGEQLGMGDIMLQKGALNPDQVDSLRKKLDDRIKVLIVKERVEVPVAVPAEEAKPVPMSQAKTKQADAAEVEQAEAAEASQGTASGTGSQAGRPPVRAKLGLFEGLTFCDKCGEYIAEDDIEAGKVRRVENSYFCPQCVQENPRLGERVGDYQLWELLGRGRIGETYKASSLASQRVVALKMIEKELAIAPDFIARLEQAVKAAQRLQHPQVARALGFEKRENVYLLTTEYVGERSLRDLLLRRVPSAAKKGKGIELARAVEIAKQVAGAIGFASDKKVPHGELGPEKILLGAKGLVKLADIGLRTRDLLANLTPPRKPDEVMGFLDYLAPEVRESPDAISFLSDQWALGGVLYTMLTAKRFSTRVAGDGMVEAATEIPESILAVLMTMTAENPRDRFKSPKHLIREFDRL